MENRDIDMGALAQAIVRRREGARWSTYRLAEKAGVSDPYLREIEGGKKKRIGISIVARIAYALGITTDDLLADIGLPTVGGMAGLVPPEVTAIYNGLPPHARRVALGHLRLVREMHAGYEVLPEDEEQLAAYDRPDIAADAYRESLGWTDEEAP